MKIIHIIETGAPPASLQARHGRYTDMMIAMLGEGFGAQVHDARRGDFPGTLKDGLIVTGSPAGVYESDPWIAALIEWLAQQRGKVPMVGICFGHQAMATAFGGRVEKVERGWGIGLQSYEVRARPPFMHDAPDTIAIPASHQDQVVVAPADALVTLSSDFTPHAGLAYGDDAISFQAHPEFTPAFARDLIETRRGRAFSDEQADGAIQSLSGPDERLRVQGWIRRFLSA
ncbi:MAG: type 1 glutamine amidotransferase [Brevundimonas sp.]|jgi:GMP synthase-like glutamine amidotransferase|uniref:type 1 glutamine amidotransferase n=1 Tax=Brevundimonas sp. TaxID=1871086 RepID=UPI00391C403F